MNLEYYRKNEMRILELSKWGETSIVDIPFVNHDSGKRRKLLEEMAKAINGKVELIKEGKFSYKYAGTYAKYVIASNDELELPLALVEFHFNAPHSEDRTLVIFFNQYQPEKQSKVLSAIARYILGQL